ncbi:MAG: tRNA (adenosine(37)-N6)-threonylcarbamoyltransferase complex dimerization subunit type 1 TsaB [Symploca sp. SIO2C1]|nr:tRNA (adenosine(37)-N6)-threonylcarbamoyltransferase complex dimerization subunit type 1 TsaB [Symploca sp. SIO2C1]
MNLKPNKYALAFHTTSPQLGLAISNFAGDTRCQTWDLGRDLSAHLHQHLTEFITPQTWADLEFIAVAKGPGSFTSTRIGIVTTRTLAQQLDIPLFTISTLAAMAWFEVVKDPGQFEQLAPQPSLALQMPAQRSQLFTAIYQVSLEDWALTELLPDSVMTPDSWKQSLESLKMPYQLIDVPGDLGTTAMSVLELAYGLWQQGKHPHWLEALPFYGQHPVQFKG